ncbi:MAG: GFA family protein [Gammaproteobacteria bacterium]|nr:GFA family protein [Gammaproteobacteria bacterium]
MSTVQKNEGSCLCGAVKVYAESMSHEFGACHCNMCQKWTGGPLLSVFCGSSARFEGEADAIGVYDSSEWAERGFCKQCGSGLFYRMKANQECMVPVGLFDAQDDITFTRQVFIDEKPAYYAFSNKTEDLTGAEIFAMYGGDTSSNE